MPFRETRPMQNRAGMPSRTYSTAFAILAALILALPACNYPEPSSQAEATEPAAASISGTVWHDECLNTALDQVPPPGCVEDPALEQYLANGIFDTGESGLPGVSVAAGPGTCPADASITVRTDAGGIFHIEGMPPGEYCLTAEMGGNSLPAALEPGIWTNPRNGMKAITLLPGENLRAIDFGWDSFESFPPAPPAETSTPSSPPRCLDAAAFIMDVTVTDGDKFDPEDTFTKTWRVQNSGTCTWSQDYDLVFISGYNMGSASVVSLRGDVAPGKSVDLSLVLTSPRKPGTYWGYWMLRNDLGDLFGVGESGNSPLWVKIRVEPEITDWRGEYFNNPDLAGDPELIRNDEDIDFNWKGSSPASGISSNRFSARWTRRMRFDQAVYRFSFKIDDGMRFWVDDRLVIDEWETGSARTVSVFLEMTKGKHDLKVAYFEDRGDARIQFDLKKETPALEGRWLARYWYNRTLDSKWAVVETSERVAFDWGRSAPAAGIPEDDFSAAWDGEFTFEPGNYRFYARADDGVRVDVNQTRIIDEWHSSSANETYTADMALDGMYEIEISFFERNGNAKLDFWWEKLEPSNEAPRAAMDDYHTLEGEMLIVASPGVMANDDDPEGAPLTATLVSGTSSGRVELNRDGSFQYQPDAGFIGEDEFSYHVSDGELVSGVVPVLITVHRSNTPPVASDDHFICPQGGSLEVAAPGVLLNDRDVESDPLRASIESGPSAGSAVLAEDGSFNYVPDPGFAGLDEFAYRVNDGKSTSNIAIVSIEVHPSISLPAALDDAYLIEAGPLLRVEPPGILANDSYFSGTAPTVVVLESPEHGTLTMMDDGSFEYRPAGTFITGDRFTYHLEIEGRTSQTATVHIIAGMGIQPAVAD
jgi:hypothetical protein